MNGGALVLTNTISGVDADNVLLPFAYVYSESVHHALDCYRCGGHDSSPNNATQTSRGSYFSRALEFYL